MGLTGLEIFKQLPKTNCKECGFPTCLAFAMALASGKANLDSCPYVSDQAREALESASAPPMATVTIGTGEQEFTIGGETVAFRHDKRFENMTGIAISVADTDGTDAIKEKVNEVNKLLFDRVGMIQNVNLVAVNNKSGDAEKFVEAVKAVKESSKFAIALITEDPAVAEKALEVCASDKPLLYAATNDNYETMTELAKKSEVVLGVKGTDLNNLSELVEKIQELGYKQLVIDTGARELSQVLADQTQIRRQALRKVRSLGYPAFTMVCDDDPIQAVADASVYISKYAGIIVFPSADPAEILPLITLRLNIYTDPQKPIAVEAKIHEVGEPDENSPVFITTNFSLTFFCVQGDIEAARATGYILPVDTDGTSVLTAWASGNLTPENINESLQSTGIMDKVNHKKIIIPGGVAVLSGKLEDVTGLEIMVGPRESSGLPTFLKQRWNA
ncbi:MAG: acetyl-CoA decarbonylase/synthase complex subunit gamma [Clostridiales bacterium]|nr:acetyl-CoA decarbonylase/synthase complex subunit gamma [Clostridiales bacterium]MCF8021941.1 acetyl-CoA decarbonylase/synthase complex subunit gamma [Clostridiales bacterium]